MSHGTQKSLTGRWKGHYVQNGAKFGITVSWTQNGTGISGEMNDLQTEREQPLSDVVAQSNLPPGADEQIAERIYELLPDQPRTRIQFRSVLPESSSVEGTIQGKSIKFRKTYQGQTKQEYKVGDEKVHSFEDGHAVEYQGQLSVDGDRINGEWIIYQPGLPGGLMKDKFQLDRIG